MRLKHSNGEPERADLADKDQDNRKASSTPQQGGIVVALPFEQSAAETPKESEAVDGRLVDRQIQAAIGRQLRMMYNDVASEPVPDKLLKLLDELSSKSDGKP